MGYRIPLFELTVGPKEERALVETLRSRWISMGSRVLEFEKRFAALHGANHAVAVSSCTAALHLALRALDIGPGDEVIVPSLTFVATVNAVRYVGAVPVFADIAAPDTLALDPADVARRVTPRTRAIIPMHYGGHPADMDELAEIAHRHSLRIVEDAAHAPAARYKGRPVGTLGDAACFSFFSNKNITCAEGGALLTDDPDIAARARLLRSHGMTTLSFERAAGHATSYDVVELGYNYRLDDLRAAMLNVQLDRLTADIEARRRLFHAYAARLANMPGVILPYRNQADDCSHYIMPILLEQGGAERRNAVRDRLAEQGIQTSVHYPAVHRFSIYERFAAALPRTEWAADHEITLPLYPSLTSDDVTFICDALEQSL